MPAPRRTTHHSGGWYQDAERVVEGARPCEHRLPSRKAPRSARPHERGNRLAVRKPPQWGRTRPVRSPDATDNPPAGSSDRTHSECFQSIFS